MLNDLSYWANVASILTFFITLIGAAVGIFGYCKYQYDLREKSRRLEDYLRCEKEKRQDKGQRSVLRIIRDVGLTKEEIIKISFRNSHVGRRVGSDPETGMADVLLFQYLDDT